jgi:hypothetical protein
MAMSNAQMVEQLMEITRVSREAAENYLEMYQNNFDVGLP